MILALRIYILAFPFALLLGWSLCAAAKNGDRQLNIGDEE